MGLNPGLTPIALRHDGLRRHATQAEKKNGAISRSRRSDPLSLIESGQALTSTATRP